MTFRIMTWNVENLFQFGAAGGPTTKDAYDAKLETLVAVIAKLSPDVLAVQEIGTTEAFADLKKGLPAAYAHSALSTHPDGRGIRVGFISKHKLNAPTEITALAENPALHISEENGAPIKAMRRGALSVTVTAHNKHLQLVTAHFKSKLLEFPGAHGAVFSTDDETLRARVASRALAVRTAEAVTLRALATAALQAHKDTALVVLGDLNDVAEAATTQIIQGPDGSQPNTGGFDREDQGDPRRLFNLGLLIPADQRYSRINNGIKELIDHMFVSAALLPIVNKKRTRPQVATHPELQGGIDSITNDPQPRKNKPASDHAPLIAEFDF